MGQTLVNPGAQVTDVLIIGQLQSQSHCSAPSGQSHLQEQGIPSPIGGGPDPEPVGSTGPTVGIAATVHFDIFPFPFLTARVKEYGSTSAPVPVHFLSHLAWPEHLVPLVSIVN